MRWASETPPAQPRGKSRICVIFTGEPQPEDRNWGADAKQIEAMKARLAEAEKKLGNVELVVGQSRSPQETAGPLGKGGAGSARPGDQRAELRVDARVVNPVLEAGRPLAVFSLPASGHDWMYAPGGSARAIAWRCWPAATTTNWSAHCACCA